MKKCYLLFVVSCSLLFATIAQSALITANGNEINPLNISAKFSTFEAFYDFRFEDYSVHTGYEKANRVVFYLAQIDNSLALIMTAGGVGGFTGVIDATVKGTKGAVSFVNDPDGIDPFDGTTINWTFSRDKNDGLIYSGLDFSKWDLDFSLRKLGGGLTGIDVLTFDEQGNKSVATSFVGVNHTLQFSSVNAPATLSIIVVGLLALFANRLKR